MIIIGKHSFIVEDALREFEAISHREVENVELFRNKVVVVFSWARSLQQNMKIADLVISGNPKKIIFISSVTALLPQAKFWNYPYSKLLMERYYQSNFHNTVILRIGMYEASHDQTKLSGVLPITTKNMLISTIKSENNFLKLRNEINCWETTTRPMSRGLKALVKLYVRVFSISRIMARLLDVFLKLSGSRIYGYTLFTITQYRYDD